MKERKLSRSRRNRELSACETESALRRPSFDVGLVAVVPTDGIDNCVEIVIWPSFVNGVRRPDCELAGIEAWRTRGHRSRALGVAVGTATGSAIATAITDSCMI